MAARGTGAAGGDPRSRLPQLGLGQIERTFFVAAFRGGLAEVGYVEPQNVIVELRWAGTQSERLPALAAELVQRKVAVIVAGGFGGPIFAAKAATSTIPIVFAYGGDPVKAGIVESFNPPWQQCHGSDHNERGAWE